MEELDEIRSRFQRGRVEVGWGIGGFGEDVVEPVGERNTVGAHGMAGICDEGKGRVEKGGSIENRE